MFKGKRCGNAWPVQGTLRKNLGLRVSVGEGWMGRIGAKLGRVVCCKKGFNLILKNMETLKDFCPEK